MKYNLKVTSGGSEGGSDECQHKRQSNQKTLNLKNHN